MKITLRGAVWKLLRTRVGLGPTKEAPKGFMGFAHDVGKEIRVRPSEDFKRPQVELETLIHEMLHACFWDLDEEAIATSGKDIAQVLWRIGYRLPPKKVASS